MTLTKEQKRILLLRITQEVLGYSPYGHFDKARWKKFESTYFYRPGKMLNEEYSATINAHLSGAAMSQTIGEIKDRIINLLDKIPEGQ